MTVRILRYAAIPAVLACTAGACSNTPPPPDTVIDATLGGGQSNITCDLGKDEAITVGTFTGRTPATVADGNKVYGGAPVHVTCTVSSNGDGFDLKLSATV